MKKSQINKTFTKQIDQFDCGVACLLSILKYHGGNKSFESLRELSGTSKQGTTLLGLYQAANKIGFIAKGYETDFKYLNKIEYPSILHVNFDNKMQHYFIYYGYKNGTYIIGDPGRGIIEYTEEELSEIWKSKSLLELIPTDELEQAIQIRKDKWEWFKSLVKEDAGILWIIFFISLVVTALGMVMAIYSQKLIDDILPSKNSEKLVISLILITILLTFKAYIGYIVGFLANKQGKDFNNRLIGRFFESLLYLPKSFFDNRRIGELVERMNDTSHIQAIITGVVGGLLKNFLLVIIGEVVLFLYSPPLGTLSLISFPVFGFISWRYHKRIVNGQREVMVANAHKSSNYVNSMQGIDAIKGSHKEEEFASLNQLIYGHFQDKIFSLGKVSISLQLVSEIASVILTIASLSLGSWMVISEKMTIGELMAIFGINGAVFPAIVSLAFANITLQGAKIAFDRMYEFSAIPPEFEKESIESDEIFENISNLKINDISFRFPGRKQLLKGIYMELSKGEMVALLGESGCGKTTFLNILQRFYEPEGGEININSQLFKEIPIPTWRKQTGVVPQEVSLFNGTLIENICLKSIPQEMQKCIEYCMQAGFHQYFMEFPQNYSTLLGEQGINISGGQKQLVGLARALWTKPKFLILDEPTSAMDRNTENFVLKLLNSLKKDTCIILVTHRIKIARFSDRIYILEHGKIQAQGKHEELMKTENLYSLSLKELTVND
jgi:ABC-type bacteriocin/lantibiotic exporter with double-glycine peptidase domain